MIFVAGIHGVGKTTFCKHLSNLLNQPHYSSGQLINNFLGKKAEDKEVQGVEQNQNILLEAIKSQTNQDNIILDGHFCLLNDLQNVEEIPITTFKEINPRVIIILHNDIDVILQRLYVRDNKKYNAEVLKELQKAEVSYGKKVAKILNSKLILIKSTNIDMKLIVEEVNNDYRRLLEI